MECGNERVPVRPEIAQVEAYVPGESLDAFATRTGVARDQLIKLNSNESPYPPSPRVSHALGNHTAYNLYPDPDGHELIAAISAYVGVEPRHLMVANGSNELITQLWRVFIGAGESVVTCSPTFSLYTTATTLARGTLINVPRGDDYALDVPGILAALRDDTRLIIVCSPNNPTGNLAARTDVDALLATGRIVVVDEAYIEFAGDDALAASPITRVPAHDNLVVLRTFSKWAGLAGLRLGYGVFPAWLVPHVQKLQLPFEVNLAAHIAARETLADMPLLRERIAGLVDERDRLHAVLAAQPYLRIFPSRGNFLLAELTDPRLTVADFRARMEAAGIILRYFRTADLARHVRLTVGAAQHTDTIAAVLGDISRRLDAAAPAHEGTLAR
ncbi:MAG: histidinol-phosphate transaminase [Ktedonobacterales bacterium]